MKVLMEFVPGLFWTTSNKSRTLQIELRLHRSFLPTHEKSRPHTRSDLHGPSTKEGGLIWLCEHNPDDTFTLQKHPTSKYTKLIRDLMARESCLVIRHNRYLASYGLAEVRPSHTRNICFFDPDTQRGLRVYYVYTFRDMRTNIHIYGIFFT